MENLCPEGECTHYAPPSMDLLSTKWLSYLIHFLNRRELQQKFERQDHFVKKFIELNEFTSLAHPDLRD